MDLWSEMDRWFFGLGPFFRGGPMCIMLLLRIESHQQLHFKQHLSVKHFGKIWSHIDAKLCSLIVYLSTHCQSNIFTKAPLSLESCNLVHPQSLTVSSIFSTNTLWLVASTSQSMRTSTKIPLPFHPILCQYGTWSFIILSSFCWWIL